MTALTDALADDTVLNIEAVIYDRDPRLVQPYLDVVAAARLVADAPEVWWCEEHHTDAVGASLDAEGKNISPHQPPTAYCWYWQFLRAPSDARERPCRMVRILLVDPGKI